MAFVVQCPICKLRAKVPDGAICAIGHCMVVTLALIWPITAPFAVCQEKEQVYKEINAETATAYRKMGGIEGRWVKSEVGPLYFSSDTGYEKRGLPGFGMGGFLAPKVRFPAVDVPFGLSFVGNSSLTEAHLKQIAALDNLTALELIRVKLSGAGLRRACAAQEPSVSAFKARH